MSETESETETENENETATDYSSLLWMNNCLQKCVITYPDRRPSTAPPGSLVRPATAAAMRDGRKARHHPGEKVVRHRCHTSWLPKQSPTPPWQKTLDQPMVTVINTPHYKLSRSRSKIHVELRQKQRNETDASRDTGQHMERDEEIDGLQQEISLLSASLQLERENHFSTKQKAADELRDKIAEMKQSHSRNMINLREANERAASDLKVELSTELEDCQQKTNAIAQELRSQIELLEAQFVAYRTRLMQELQLESKLREAGYRFAAEYQSHVDTLRMELKDEKRKDLAQQEIVYREKLQQLRNDHQQQLKELRQRFSEREEDRQRLVAAENRLKDLPVELQSLEENLRNVHIQTDECQRQNAHLKHTLKTCEESFEDRTRQVDNQYENKLNDLRLQFIALRRLYLRKCGQLADDGSDVLKDDDARSIRSIKELMKALIETHCRTETSLLNQELDVTRQPRRFSTSGAIHNNY